MVTMLGLAMGGLLTLIAVGVHLTRGTGWRPRTDMADEVTERRASTVPETGFPEPMNRAVGGGGAASAVGGAEGAGGELDDGETAQSDDGPWSLPDDEADEFDVDFDKEGETISVEENKTILEAGEEEGWDLPYACRQGQCLSCSAHIEDGPAEEYVTHHDQEMLGEAELEEGYTLTCVAYPKDEFTIETAESP